MDILASHNSKTSTSDIALYEERAKNVDLIWCSQVISILEKYNWNLKKISINDIGCNCKINMIILVMIMMIILWK